MSSSTGHKTWDVAVLGGGSAGYAAAQKAAAGGLKTVLVESAPVLGGLCILRGCMPSKALLYAAEVKHLAESGRTWGLRIPRVSFDFAAVMARKKAMVDDFARYRRHQLQKGQFKLIRARAAFTDPHTVNLTENRTDDLSTLAARHFIICTGSVEQPPPLPDFANVGYMTSDDALALKRLPRSLIIVGGGLVAVEMAQFFHRFNVDVTILQRGPHILRECDADAADCLEKALRQEGIRIYTNTCLQRVTKKGSQKIIYFKHGRQSKHVAAAEILLAVGRRANTSGLGLDKIGLTLEQGRIVTNTAQKTSLPHIYAAGDCTGPHQIVHLGVEQGEIAAHNILQPRQLKRISYRLLCSVAFTDPQIGMAGLTETVAQREKIPYLAACYSFSDHGKAMIMGTTHGFVKLLAHPHTGEILGGACVGPQGGELIHEIIAAMHNRMTVQALAAMPHYHPTLAEIWTYPAAELAEKIPGRRR